MKHLISRVKKRVYNGGVPLFTFVILTFIWIAKTYYNIQLPDIANLVIIPFFAVLINIFISALLHK